MKLSVTIITLNEEKYLEKALQSFESIADEIIIVDSGSTDKTLEIAEKYGAKIYAHKFANYAEQKNYASKKANGEWILSLDGDEEIEKDLASEIKEVISLNQFDGYSIPRKNIIFGKFIKYTRWQPELDRHVWLFKKNKGKWIGDVHEEVEVEGEVGRLRHAKIHHQYKTVSEFMTMINEYSDFEAQKKVKEGIKFNYVMLIVEPVYNFLVRYFYRLGFLDGLHGFILSCLMAYYHLVLWVKIWEILKVSKAS